MTTAIKLRRADYDAMVAHALEDAPVECCGIVATLDGASAGVYRARNTEASPYRFSIDPRDYLKMERAIEAQGATVAGFYHSHTGTPPVPSPTDIRAMTGAGFTPPFIHFVIGVADRTKPEVRVWHIDAGTKTEQHFDLTD